MDKLKAQKSIRNAGIAGIIWCIIILIGLLKNPGLNANLFSLILVIALTYGIFAKSRFCSIMMFIFFMFTIGIAVIVYFIKYGILNHMLYFFGGIIFLGGFIYFFINGIIGTFAYHFINDEHEEEKASIEEEKTDKEM